MRHALLIAVAFVVAGCGSTLFNTDLDNPQVKSCIEWVGVANGGFAPVGGQFSGNIRGYTATGDAPLELCLEIVSPQIPGE